LEMGLVYPPQSTILKTELHAAQRVAEVIFARGLARVERPKDIAWFVESQTYQAQYQPLV
jgi:malate dehydrogenase (oxaloacetate-decarboxylating)(NADP+)